MAQPEAESLARAYCSFIDASPSPYHAVRAAEERLKAHGFLKLSAKQSWLGSLQPGGRYYTIQNGSTIAAFSVGGAFFQNEKVDEPRFVVIGAHTDSPCFKVKPNAKIDKLGYAQLGVECYGGGLWHTWFDRDLTLAGRLITADHSIHLVHVKDPILRIPNLAIHLNREVSTEGFKPNKESHTTPIFATSSSAPVTSNSSEDEGASRLRASIASRLPEGLLAKLAEKAGVEAKDVVDYELVVCDTQPAAIGGLNGEFIFSPRLDNLASSFAAIEALCAAVDDEKEEVADRGDVHMVVLYDHEEVGSTSAHGAQGPLLQDLIRRICSVYSASALNADVLNAVVRRSFLVSADMAHAVHPNYASKHEERHRPQLGGGLVVKTNQNQRYATTAFSGYVMRRLAEIAAEKHTIQNASSKTPFIPLQEFVVPNDAACGSTIGPIIAAGCGIRTVDVGQPQLAMHSVREMCATVDLLYTKLIFEQLFHSFASTFANLDDDEQF